MRHWVAASLVFLPFSAIAQASAGPRAGAWAAEVGFSGPASATSGSLLRFRNDQSAWLFGLNATVGAHNADPGSVDEDETVVVLGARVGIRSLRSPGSATRPTVGFGVQGRYSQPGSEIRIWDAGVYGELGITRFFGSSFSVGGLAEVQVRYGETRFEGPFADTRSSDTVFEFDAVRLAATVYF